MDLGELKEKAKSVAQNAHAPYSNFRVGCALLTATGNVYVGCNVENSSFGLTVCAERAAIFSAISQEGKVDINQVVIYTETEKPPTPCGACRQIIFEFCGKDVQIHCFCDSEKAMDTSIRELLPSAFDLDDY